MASESLIRIRLKLVRATFYGCSGKNSSQKIYLTGTLSEPIIQNNSIVLKEGRRVQVLYSFQSLQLALESIAKCDCNLTFLIKWTSDTLSNTIVDYQGNEVVKVTSDSLCEK